MADIVVTANQSPLAKALVDSLGASFVSLETGKFADTEWYVQFHDVSCINRNNVLCIGQFAHVSVCALSDQLMQILFLAHQSKVHHAKSVVALLPYLAYSRQCKDVNSEHVGPLDAIGKLCAAVGVDRIVSCEVHEEACSDVLPLPLHNITLDSVWRDLLMKELSPDERLHLCFVSPDKGGVKRARRMAALFNASCAFVTKHREGHDKSVAIDLSGDSVRDKVVVLIDDIVATGITVVQACEKVREHGAKRVLGCFVHPVLSPGSVARLDASNIEKVWVCDTIMLNGVDLGSKISVVSINKTISEVVRERK